MENEEKSIYFSDCLNTGLHVMSNLVNEFIKDLYQLCLDISNKFTFTDKEVNDDK